MKSFEEPVFSCKGENLSLSEIQKRKITAVTIKYLSEVGEEKRELTIRDEQGISLFFELIEPFASINFWDKGEWSKIVSYDDKTLFKRDLKITKARYQLNFHPSNLIKVVWE